MNRRERQRRIRRRTQQHPVKRVLLLGTLLGICCVVIGLLGVVGWVLATADSAPNIAQLHPRVPGSTSQIFAANGQSLGYMNSDVLRTPLTQSEQPDLLRDATVAIEDRRFFHHGGVDYIGLLRAAVKDVFEGGGLQGGSTLTMQLVNNVYLPTKIRQEHNLRYKIIQAKLANELESKQSKNWILTQYLNDVPYGTVDGQSAIGVGAASQMFFDKPVQKLDIAQFALLAGLPQAPSEYNPFEDPKLARARRSEVLAAMVKSGYITQAQEERANRSKLQVVPNTTYQTVRQPYVFNYVEQQLVQDLGQAVVDRGGLKVYTTINLADQQYAREALLAHEGEAGDPAAVVATVDPSNGHVLAIAQNTNYGTGKGETTFNYATDAHRQTGSAFKVFVLMTLIHDYDGNPNDTYYDSKYLPAGWLPGYPTYSVQTAEESYQGVINVTQATTTSDNTVFAQLGVDLGIPKVNQIAHAMGITSKLTDNPSEAIGGLEYGVSPLQMADAYATLANGGEHYPTTIISKVVLPSGKVVNLGDPTPTRVFSYGEVYAADQVLQTVLTASDGTGTAANYGCPAAGKTGTTSNYTDAWFVGYTPKLSTAVWVGYPNSDVYMNDVNGLGPGYGGTLAAPIWHDFMEQASDGYCGGFPAPSVPWAGTAYVGAHSVSPKATPNVTSTGTGTTTGTTTGPIATTTTPAQTTTSVTPTPPTPPAASGNSGGGGLPGKTRARASDGSG